MSELKLNSNFDLDLGPDSLQNFSIITDQKECIKQRIIIRIRSFTNDWFANLDDGLPYFRDIFVKNPDRAVILGLYRGIILGVPGVTGIDDLDYNLDTSLRSMALSFVAKTNEGTIPIELSLL